LPDAELDVLACLWQKGPLTSNQLCELIAGYRPMTHGSMMTLLKRLQSKGWVSRKKGPVGKAFIYRAAREPGPTHRDLLGNLVRRIFGGNGLAVVSALFDAKPPTRRELDRLQQLLDELRVQNPTGDDEGERPD
jgi:BlaI family transcriptional regulator, penicillinase repressor